MRRTFVGLFGGVALMAAGAATTSCGDSTPGPTTPGGDSTTDVFAAAANPLNVTVSSDASHAGSALIDQDGGTVTATGADGTVYTLDIPAGAVGDTVTITLTPLTSMSGAPLSGGLVAGVQMAPDGLVLYQDATLTIAPVTAVALADQTLLGYSSTGSDLHLAIPASLDATISIVVQHFSGTAVGSGTSSDRAAILLRHAADYEARLNGEIAAILGKGRELGLLGVGELSAADIAKLNDLFESFYGHVIRPRVIAASSSCANAMLALQTLLRAEQLRQRLGVGSLPNLDADLATVIDAEVNTCAWLAGPTTVGEFTMSGKICNLNANFTLTMYTPDGSLAQNFVPTSKTTGTESYSGVLAETSVQGSGTYTITGLGDIGTALNLSDHQCISNVVVNTCGNAAVPIPLKRLETGC